MREGCTILKSLSRQKLGGDYSLLTCQSRRLLALLALLLALLLLLQLHAIIPVLVAVLADPVVLLLAAAAVVAAVFLALPKNNLFAKIYTGYVYGNFLLLFS